jgi:hypothetical protein
MKHAIQNWAAGNEAAIPRSSRKIAIMVPLPRPDLKKDEEISIRHLRAHLDHYDKFLLVPRGMKAGLPGFGRVELDRKHFGSAVNHNRMLYLPSFWMKFADYEHVLMYHLDSLVFSDQLTEWCDKGYDYIGAPFIRCGDSPWVREDRVGNGGFALYRVGSVLRVLWKRYRQRPSRFIEDHCWRWIELQKRMLKPVRSAIPQWMRGAVTDPLRRTVKRLDHTEAVNLGNDGFWADEAGGYLPEFKIAPLEEGLKFAFEVAPRVCFERNGGRMPFGCHAWTRYDRSFWEKHLINTD